MRVHRNVAAGETLTVFDAAPLLRAELAIEPVHHAPPAHVHPHSAERFTVIDGVIRIRVGTRRRILTAGESARVPAGVVHGYEGVPGRSARVNVELDPSGRMAEFLRRDLRHRLDKPQCHHRCPTAEVRSSGAAAVPRRHHRRGSTWIPAATSRDATPDLRSAQLLVETPTIGAVPNRGLY